MGFYRDTEPTLPTPVLRALYRVMMGRDKEIVSPQQAFDLSPVFSPVYSTWEEAVVRPQMESLPDNRGERGHCLLLTTQASHTGKL